MRFIHSFISTRPVLGNKESHYSYKDSHYYGSLNLKQRFSVSDSNSQVTAGKPFHTTNYSVYLKSPMSCSSLYINSCLTVNLHLSVRLCSFYLATGGLINTHKHSSHNCFTSGYYVQCSNMLYFVQHKKNKLLESFCLCCSYPQFGFLSEALSPAVTQTPFLL